MLHVTIRRWSTAERIHTSGREQTRAFHRAPPTNVVLFWPNGAPTRRCGPPPKQALRPPTVPPVAHLASTSIWLPQLRLPSRARLLHLRQHLVERTAGTVGPNLPSNRCGQPKSGLGCDLGACPHSTRVKEVGNQHTEQQACAWCCPGPTDCIPLPATAPVVHGVPEVLRTASCPCSDVSVLTLPCPWYTAAGLLNSSDSPWPA